MSGFAENGPIDVPPAPATARGRLDSIDMVRGLIMVIMALDHTRGYFSNAHFDPVNLKDTTVAYFLTRWITHYCAPVFVFLAGTGCYLAGARGMSRPQLAWFLLSRGLWIVFLDVTLVNLGWAFTLNYSGQVDGQGATVIGGGIVSVIGMAMALTAYSSAKAEDGWR